MIDQNTFEIMSSPTLGKLAKFAENAPWDVNNEDDLKSALSTCLLELCKAMDAGRIHFDKDEDSAIFHGLLSVNLAQFFDGKVWAETVQQFSI